MVPRERESAAGLDSWLEIPGVCGWTWNVTDECPYWSPEVCELYGVTEAPDREGFLALVHPADRTRVEKDIADYLSQGETFDHRFTIVRPSGEQRYVIDRGRVFRDPNGRAVKVVGFNIDITEERKADEAALTAVRRAAFAARIGGLVSWEIDSETDTIVAAEGLPELFGMGKIEPPPAHVDDYGSCIHPDDMLATRMELDKARVVGGHYFAEFRVRNGNGWRWLRGCGEGVNVNGKVRIVGFNMDISHEHAAREHQEIVARELAHRIKNTLAIVQAIARQSLPKAGYDEELKRFSARLSALAASTDLLTKGVSTPVAIDKVVEVSALQLIDDPRRITASGPSLCLPARMSTSVVMALHELLTNAIKYGSLSNETGTVQITWERSGDYLELSWRESGGPPVEPPSRRGFGSRLIERVINAEPHSTATLAFTPEGVRWNMTTRLADPAAIAAERTMLPMQKGSPKPLTGMPRSTSS